MRILIVVPPLPAASGNQVTARRYAFGLERRGHAVRLVAAAPDHIVDLQIALAAFRPDLVHLLHAFRTGSPWLAAAPPGPPPFAVTLTGTDIHTDFNSPARGPLIQEVLARASAVITQNPLTADVLKRLLPELAGKMHFLPPGVLLGNQPYSLRRRHQLPCGGTLLLHPAGIRPIKRNLELLQLLEPLAGADHPFTVGFCGPVLDPAYGREFLRALEDRPWARYFGTIPPEAMAAALQESDIVLNNSTSEGMPNALLEAAVIGTPILARDIPGNAAIVTHGYNGLLYRDDASFRCQAEALLNYPGQRQRLSRPEPDRYSPEREAAALEGIYLSDSGLGSPR